MSCMQIYLHVLFKHCRLCLRANICAARSCKKPRCLIPWHWLIDGQHSPPTPLATSRCRSCRPSANSRLPLAECGNFSRCLQSTLIIQTYGVCVEEIDMLKSKMLISVGNTHSLPPARSTIASWPLDIDHRLELPCDPSLHSSLVIFNYRAPALSFQRATSCCEINVYSDLHRPHPKGLPCPKVGMIC